MALDLPEQIPELSPEDKINMKLDDIIKYEKMRLGISHNMQHKRRPFQYRRYKSQNWRLRGNGPNTPRFRRWNRNKWNDRVGKIKAFLERKWRSAPLNSVFHRLSWNAGREAANSKLYCAKTYRRPQLGFFPFRRKKIFQQRPFHQGPNRLRDLMARARQYRMDNGLNIQPGNVQTLTEVNIKKLSEALGGQITEVKEEQSETGTSFTIHTVNTCPFPVNGFYTPNQMGLPRFPRTINGSRNSMFSYSNQLDPSLMQSDYNFTQRPNFAMRSNIGMGVMGSYANQQQIFRNETSSPWVEYSSNGTEIFEGGQQEDYTSPMIKYQNGVRNLTMERDTPNFFSEEEMPALTQHVNPSYLNGGQTQLFQQSF